MDQYLSSIWAFSFDFAPKGWAQCNGSILPINSNQALFALLGVTFGGNGTSSFGLPDLRGRVPVGFGQGPGLSNYALGQVSGAEAVTLTNNNMPLHTHPVVTNPVQVGCYAGTTANGQSSPVNNFFGDFSAGKASATPYATTGGSLMGATTTNSSVIGSNLPIPLKNPYQALNYCIAIQGVFPSRN